MLNARIITIALSVMLMLSINLIGSAEITEDTIAAAWLFDGDAKDVSGNGFDGEVKGGKFVKGQIGDAIELNGSDEWIEIPKRIGEFEEITFAHWVKSTGREAAWRVFFNVNGWKAGTSITRCTRIIRLSSPFTATQVGMIPLQTICWQVTRWTNGSISQPPTVQKKKDSFLR